MITVDDFTKVDIRVGKIIAAEAFPEAKQPSYKLRIDFGGQIGVKQSSAHITELYELAELVGKQVLAIINFPPKKIVGFKSEVLVLGVDDDKGRVTLIIPENEAKLGGKLY